MLTALLRPAASDFSMAQFRRGCSLRSQPRFGLRPQISLWLCSGEAVRYTHILASACGLRYLYCFVQARLFATLTSTLRPAASDLSLACFRQGCSLRSQPRFGLRPQISLWLCLGEAVRYAHSLASACGVRFFYEL